MIKLLLGFLHIFSQNVDSWIGPFDYAAASPQLLQSQELSWVDRILHRQAEYNSLPIMVCGI